MAAPGAMLSGALRALTETRRRVLPTKTSANEKVKVQNTFEALQESEELIEEATADEQLERMSSKDPGAWPCSESGANNSASLSECRSAAPPAAMLPPAAPPVALFPRIASKRRWKKVTDELLCQLSEEDESWPRLIKTGCKESCGTPVRKAKQVEEKTRH